MKMMFLQSLIKSHFGEDYSFSLNVEFQVAVFFIILMKTLFLLNFENPTFCKNDEN